MIVEVNGISLYYERSGEGKPLLLLHGNGEDCRIFDRLAEKLATRFAVYAVDSRNHGQSQRTGEYSYRAMAEDVYGFIRTLDLGPVRLVGFSDGAIIGLLLAMAHGEAVDKMALLGINLKPDDFTEECYRYIEETYEKTGDPLFKMMLEQPDIELDDVRGVTAPTLLIAAENDLYKPRTHTDLAAALPNAEFMIMAGHDHGSYIIDQDILAPDLIDFFQ